MTRQPPPTEKQMIARLRRGDVAFPPLSLTWVNSDRLGIDGEMRIAWQRKTLRFGVECKRATNSRSVTEAAERSRELSLSTRLAPLVIVPFLDESALNALETEDVSGLDLCGNGLIVGPEGWFVRRTGSPNQFRTEGAIKNVYRNASSVVARLFLAKGEFASVRDALDELNRRGGRVTLPTVSKVCKELANDLVIERTRGGVTSLRLIQPEKLLDRLAANYAPPVPARRVTGKFRGGEAGEVRGVLRSWGKRTRNLVSLSGACSVGAYAVMARDGSEEYYCTDVAGALAALGDRFQPTERFATVSLLEVSNEEVYFDRREDLTASPVQTFLELASGDKRDQETAAQVQDVVLGQVQA